MNADADENRKSGFCSALEALWSAPGSSPPVLRKRSGITWFVILVLLLAASALETSAATGTLYGAGNLTLPEGIALLGGDVWEADHGLGLCRLDAAPPGAPAPFQINQATCNSAAFSPGQMAFDLANNFLYVPDNATKGRGIWRLKFNSITRTLGSPFLLAAGGGGTGVNRASAVALAGC